MTKMLPQRVDNTYQGHKLALWLFGLMVFVRIVQCTLIIFDGYNTVSKADGIPLATYPAAEASWYDGVGHAPHLEEPERFNRELAELTRRVLV